MACPLRFARPWRGIALAVLLVVTAMVAWISSPAAVARAAALASAGSVVSGTVTNEFTGAGLVGIAVELCTPDGTMSMETTTSPSGTYAFSGVASGDYRVIFWDPGAVYYAEWFSDASDIVGATPVVVSAPATVSGIDASLWPDPTHWPSFGAVDFASGSEFPWVAEQVVLSTTLTDLLTGGVIPSPPIVRGEWSKDGEAWTRLPASAIRQGSAPGEYTMTVSAQTTEPVVFRFVTDASTFVPSSESDWVTLYPKQYVASWKGPFYGGVNARAGSTVIGNYVQVVADLARPALPTTTTVVLQMSADGANWVPTGDEVTPGHDEGRFYATTYVFSRRYYRFADLSLPWNPVYSEPILVIGRSWIFAGASASRSKYPKPFKISGGTSGSRQGEGVVVEVRKPGSRRWSYSSRRLCHYFGASWSALWSYKYTPKKRGTYRFRARRAGADAWSSPVSGTVTVVVY
jgi:hypothetical protein